MLFGSYVVSMFNEQKRRGVLNNNTGRFVPVSAKKCVKEFREGIRTCNELSGKRPVMMAEESKSGMCLRVCKKRRENKLDFRKRRGGVYMDQGKPSPVMIDRRELFNVPTTRPASR